jgi:hypothetical protein
MVLLHCLNERHIFWASRGDGTLKRQHIADKFCGGTKLWFDFVTVFSNSFTYMKSREALCDGQKYGSTGHKSPRADPSAVPKADIRRVRLRLMAFAGQKPIRAELKWSVIDMGIMIESPGEIETYVSIERGAFKCIGKGQRN